MSRIVEAINAMISNKDKINCCGSDENLLWFTYDTKHKWSIAEHGGDHFLAYYPGSGSIEDLISKDRHELEECKAIYYSSAEINTREARQSFRELYSICNEKLHNMDKVFDEIIGPSPEDELPF